MKHLQNQSVLWIASLASLFVKKKKKNCCIKNLNRLFIQLYFIIILTSVCLWWWLWNGSLIVILSEYTYYLFYLFHFYLLINFPTGDGYITRADPSYKRFLKLVLPLNFQLNIFISFETNRSFIDLLTLYP